MAHVLVIIVSVGFGVVKPRLGATLNQVVAVGVLYFIFCTVEGLTRVSKAMALLPFRMEIIFVYLAIHGRDKGETNCKNATGSAGDLHRLVDLLLTREYYASTAITAK